MKDRHLRLTTLLLSSCAVAPKIHCKKQETSGPEGRRPKEATAWRSASPMFQIENIPLRGDIEMLLKDTVAACIGSARDST
jgi:hypothetical protein